MESVIPDICINFEGWVTVNTLLPVWYSSVIAEAEHYLQRVYCMSLRPLALKPA